MALADVIGPSFNSTKVLKNVLNESIKAVLCDSTGRIWLIVPSGHALVFAGFDRTSEAFWVASPEQVITEVEKRKNELQPRIQDLRDVAPGVDL